MLSVKVWIQTKSNVSAHLITDNTDFTSVQLLILKTRVKLYIAIVKLLRFTVIIIHMKSADWLEKSEVIL